jgi:hypothetical protein
LVTPHQARKPDEKIAVMVRLRPLGHVAALCGALTEFPQQHLKLPEVDVLRQSNSIHREKFHPRGFKSAPTSACFAPRPGR